MVNTKAQHKSFLVCMLYTYYVLRVKHVSHTQAVSVDNATPLKQEVTDDAVSSSWLCVLVYYVGYVVHKDNLKIIQFPSAKYTSRGGG